MCWPFLPFETRTFKSTSPNTRQSTVPLHTIERLTSSMRKQKLSAQASKSAAAHAPQRQPPKGFVTAPTLHQLRPTPREVSLLETLWSWQEQSARSRTVLGQPLK